MTIEQLTILTTNRCTAECTHCLMSSSPARKEKLTYSKIKYAISKILAHATGLKVVIFSGGEATLLKSDLLDAIAFCSENNLLTRLVTNAWWAKSEQQALAYIESLREAGLNEINFSVDDYHLPYVNFNNVKIAWAACKNQGFSSVVLANCFGKNTILSSDMIQSLLTENIQQYWNSDGQVNRNVKRDKDGTLYLLSNARLQCLGKGKEILKDEIIYPTDPSVVNHPCPWAMNSAALSPVGDLLACCGIEMNKKNHLNFGCIDDIDLNHISATHKNKMHIVRLVKEIGPYKIMSLIKRQFPDVHFKANYSAMCEICEDIMNCNKLPDVVATMKIT